MDYRHRLYETYVTGCHGEPIDATSVSNARSPYLERLVRLHFPADPSTRVFELGCGSGALLRTLHARGYTQLSGVDTSPEQVALAHSAGIDNVRQGDLFDILREQRDRSIGVVVAFDVVEHLTKDEVLSLATEVVRVLAPSGRFIIHTVNAESPFFGRVRYGDFTHENAFTRVSIRQVLANAGFRSVQSYEDTPTVHGVKSFLRAAVWHVVRGGLRIAVAAETGDLGSDAILSQNFLTVAET